MQVEYVTDNLDLFEEHEEEQERFSKLRKRKQQQYEEMENNIPSLNDMEDEI